MEANNEKSMTTLFSQTFEVPESKVPLFFHFWPPGQDIDILCFLLFFSVTKTTDYIDKFHTSDHNLKITKKCH